MDRVDERALAEAKRRTPLSTLIRSDLPMKRVGNEWACCCPFHDEKSPSFFVCDKKGFWHCFGCGAHGDHVSWLMVKRGMGFRDAAELLLSQDRPHPAARMLASYREAGESFRENGGRFLDAESEKAKAVLRDAVSIAGTLAERYLRRRGITLPRLPESLLYGPRVWHSESATAWPCLIGVVRDSRDEVCAIHRIYVDPATETKIGTKPAKKSLGSLKDGAVRLGPAGRILGIAEGIESGLSAKQIYGLPVWVALGTGHMPKVRLPPQVEEVMIFRDRGEAGFEWAVKAAEVWENEGRKVMIEPPPAPHSDWNDVLQTRRELHHGDG